MNPVPYVPSEPQETSSIAPTIVLLFNMILIYFMYSHFDMQYQALKIRQSEVDLQFNTVEGRLGTLHDMEQDLNELKEAATETKDSWEDDIEEPGKYQAIVGTGSMNGIDIELRLINQKLNTFKSNRYWLLNDSINMNIIKYICNKRHVSKFFCELDDRLLSTEQILTGLDSILLVECSLPKRWNPPYAEDPLLCQTVAMIWNDQGKSLTWKRALVDAT
jgi:hypothetical protein